MVGKTSPVLFPFPPVALPLNDEGKIIKENEATQAYYSTFVFSTKEEKFYIFEFTEEIVNALLAYRQRHGTLSTLEILLSRERDSSLRITTGNIAVKVGFIPKAQLNEYSTYYNKLFDMYMSKLGKELPEIKILKNAKKLLA